MSHGRLPSVLDNAVVAALLFFCMACAPQLHAGDAPGPLKNVYTNAVIEEMILPAPAPHDIIAAWRVKEGSEPVGYGLRVRGNTRSGWFQALLILDAELVIKQLHVERYLGSRGGEIKRASFKNQFHGKSPQSSFILGQDLDAVTGATISSRAVANAVRSSIRWLQEQVPK